ncbi:conserved Plasmodium protein, unknown function [Plasmodium gallinaceum]|uniref:BRO1 domain-containing protein n=1 Tax=Plasmodium gallinaceum TaxID=5849 RepID=A0A1J1GR79_PLAGA|nr:conserved Plasmodium protein, unknown function [Plasmodium gallinaceum]CRG93546.1 conserved Plasmodium protein, unknown function [Plasmodium gallinaceum]
MQVVSDLVNLKYLYDKIQINKIINKNLKELIKNPDFSFEEEINNFTNLRNSIIIEQYKGLSVNLLNLYKEYLFYFETFKRKNLLKGKKILYTNDIFEKNKKVEYEFHQENTLIIYNIGILKSHMLKLKKNSDDIKLLNKISNEVVEIFNYLFKNLNEQKLSDLTDINCISSYIFLCLVSAYHENMFYNTAILKKYKRNLLSKLSFNIYTYFNDAHSCLDGKFLDVFKQVKHFSNAKNNLQYIRNTNGYFYNYIYVNKKIFISISNYHSSLKYVELSNSEELKVKKYEEEKIGEIICRLNYSLDNVNKGIELCKKYNLNISIVSLKEKIIKILEFFEYENKNIYFEVVPPYENLEPIKGTEVVKIKNINISEIYTKKKISNRLKLLFNEKAKNIYECYNKEALSICEKYNKIFLSLNDQYKMINLSYRKNIILTLNNVIIDMFNRKKQIYQPNDFENILNFLMNVEQNLKEILIEAENKLTNENNNHLEFQKKYVNVCINQDSLNSYNNFLFHLSNFKKSLDDLGKNNTIFKTFHENNYSNFQICEMDILPFFEYVVNQLNHCIDINLESLENDYLYYKNILSEENENTSNSFNSITDLENSNKLCLNYSNFSNFIKLNNLSFAIQKNANNQNLFHYNILNKYINIQSEEKIYYVIISIYFSLNIQLTNFSKDLIEIKDNMDEQFLNMLIEEDNNEKLNELLEEQKKLLDIKKKKLEENISVFEKDINQFYNYYHEYNKLEYFKTIEDINNFINELKKTFDNLYIMQKQHLYTLKSALLFKDDINKYIFMRESERSKIRVQQISNYTRNIQDNSGHFY